MTSHRYVALMMEDAQGASTACLLDFDDVHATSKQGADALAQLKELLQWRLKKGQFLPAPELTEPRLVEITLPVRPAYRTARRLTTSRTILEMRIIAVAGRREDTQSSICVAPLHGVRFEYTEADELDPILREHVGSVLGGLEPRDLARHLPPARVWLEDVVVRIPSEQDRPPPPPSLPVLGAVAEPAVRRRGTSRARAWGRETEVDRLVELGRLKANVLLVGPPGVGKSTVLAEAIRKLERVTQAEGTGEDVPRSTPRFWSTSAARLVAGMAYLGQWQERCERVVEELHSIDGLLCVENLLELVRVGGADGSSGLAAFLEPYLARMELRMVAEATQEELEACRRLLPGLPDLFQIVRVESMDAARCVDVLERISEAQRRGTGRSIGTEVPGAVRRLFSRFQPYSVMPGPQASFLTEVIRAAGREEGVPVTVTRVMSAFIRRTGLPDLVVDDSLSLTSEDLASVLGTEVLGQEEACRAVARTVTTFKAGMSDPGRPIATLLLSGPTGVGKTELAKALSRFLFGQGEDPDRLIRLDMSEYAGYDAVHRLLGSPHGEPSAFVRRVRRQPFCVVLLDEIEKASPEVFDVLLSVLDEGRLTDTYGRVTTFASAVILMTSNLGGKPRGRAGFLESPASTPVSEARSFFRPEFFNRLDAVVAFRPLEKPLLLRLVERELERIRGREGLVRRGVELCWTPEVVEWLAGKGFDHRYGARPLQRVIESEVVTLLSRRLLDPSAPKAGALVLQVDPEGRLGLGDQSPVPT